MNGEVVDLDILRPPPKIVKLAGKEIDISYVPCAITWDIDGIVNDMLVLDQQAIATEPRGKDARKAFDLAIDLCVAFCSWKHPDMDKDWFVKNVDPRQVNMLATTIQETLRKSYEGIEAYSGNLTAAQETATEALN